MNTGQTMLVIGAFVLLSSLTLGINRTIISNSNIGLEMEANLVAISIAQTLMDEILLKEFDERTTTGLKIYNASDMTNPETLGPEGAEAIYWVDSSYTLLGLFFDFRSKAQFDDVDDYNGYQRRSKDLRLGDFDVWVDVEYVDEDSPDDPLSMQTNHKRITVTVSHFSMTKDNDGSVIPHVLRDLSVYRRFFQ